MSALTLPDMTLLVWGLALTTHASRRYATRIALGEATIGSGVALTRNFMIFDVPSPFRTTCFQGAVRHSAGLYSRAILAPAFGSAWHFARH